MSQLIASHAFTATVDYSALPHSDLQALFEQAIEAHHNFFGMWQAVVKSHLGEETCEELTRQVYPTLASHEGNLRTVFFEELNFLWSVMPAIEGMLTFAKYDPSLLPEQLTPELDIATLSVDSMVMLWNTSTLTYVMQTGRWTDLLTERYGQDLALKMERDAWLDFGGAEEDLRYGLRAAGAEQGNVETLLRGFQFAPGEVGLVDAVFDLKNQEHGFITHRRCPSKERFGESNRARLESNCVLCVIAMRLSGEMVNENIRCRPVDIPPYREPSDHACKWEYWME